MLTKELFSDYAKRIISLRCIFYITTVCFLTGCGKDDGEVISGTARISFTHAAVDAPALDVYVQDEKITVNPLLYGFTSGVTGNPYLAVDAGTRFIRLSSNGTSNLVQGNIPVKPDSSYSVFAYDTINTAGTLRVLLLSDRLDTPAIGKSHIRFLQLSPDTGRIYVRIVNATDSITVGYRPYITATTTQELNTIAAFTPVNAGNYTLTVRLTDSTPVIFSTPIALSPGRIISIYSRGRKRDGFGTAGGFNIGSVIHF